MLGEWCGFPDNGVKEMVIDNKIGWMIYIAG